MRPGEAYLLIGKRLYQSSRLANGVGAFFLTGMMLLMTADIILRNTLNIAIQGSYELIELMCAVFISLSFAYCASLRGHISIDLVVSRLSGKAQATLNSITYLISIVVVSLLAWQSLVRARTLWRTGETTGILEIPVFPVLLVVFVGYVLFSLVWIIQLGEY